MSFYNSIYLDSDDMRIVAKLYLSPLLATLSGLSEGGDDDSIPAGRIIYRNILPSSLHHWAACPAVPGCTHSLINTSRTADGQHTVLLPANAELRRNYPV